MERLLVEGSLLGVVERRDGFEHRRGEEGVPSASPVALACREELGELAARGAEAVVADLGLVDPFVAVAALDGASDPF